MRRHLVLTEANYYPKELNSAFKSLENQNNPWGLGNDKRVDWMQGLNVNIINDKNQDDIEYLLFVGCASSTDEKAIRTLKKFVTLLNKAKISFAILGTKENCCGDPARRMGNEYLYEILANKNISMFSKYNIKNILTTCPHCYNQIKNEYKDFKKSYNVKHHADFLLDLISQNKIQINNLSKKINHDITTFHDPCYIGRYNKDYMSSRNILKNLSISVKEMYLSKEKSFCCGAGGGKMFMDEHAEGRINQERINQAKIIHAKNIVTSCPFCKTMLSDASGDDIVVQDIVDVLFDNIK
jgi:Fe-S oxidoreductase